MRGLWAWLWGKSSRCPPGRGACAEGDHFVVRDRFAWCSLGLAKKDCADHREGLAIAQYLPRSGRRPRRAPVRQDMFFRDFGGLRLKFIDGDIFERGFAGGACGLFA